MFDMRGSEYFNASITDMLGFGKIEYASGGALRPFRPLPAMSAVDNKSTVCGPIPSK